MKPASHRVLGIPQLVAFWDFQDSSFEDRSPNKIKLSPMGDTSPLAEEGVFGPYSLPFSAVGHLPVHYLVAERQQAPQLNIGGPNAQVSVVAWLNRRDTTYKSCEFVAGVWNEHQQRQYALFLNLGIRNKSTQPVTSLSQQIAGHISSHGGATPGWAYSMDASVGKTKIDFGRWHTIAITYDGVAIRSYLDGVLDSHPPVNSDFPFGANPFAYPGGIFKGVSDFTVGATKRPESVVPDGNGGFKDVESCVANPFVGLLGGLAIFDRALNDAELEELASIIPSSPAAFCS